MFVSSYSTYINTNDKLSKPKIDIQKVQEKSFNNILSKSTTLVAYDTKNLPINYISNYKSFSNKQKLLDNQTKNKNTVKFKKINDFKKINNIKNAKDSYKSNSHMFSLVSIPKTTINQTPKINNFNLLNMKHKMVNTYIENDKYYQITA